MVKKMEKIGLSVCKTWIYRLLRALHAHLPCTTLLNFDWGMCIIGKEEEEGVWHTITVYRRLPACKFHWVSHFVGFV